MNKAKVFGNVGAISVPLKTNRMEMFSYHLAAISDIPLIVDHRILLFDELSGKQEPVAEAALRRSLTTYFEEELNKTYLCWYAKANDEVAAIGGIILRTQAGTPKNPSGKWGYIMNIYTVPACRRKGLATVILNKLMDSAREKGYTAFELRASKGGEPVYIQEGFTLHPEPTYRKYPH
jgi:ribosomal protein S18 acetylase RimI-like enzyme